MSENVSFETGAVLMFVWAVIATAIYFMLGHHLGFSMDDLWHSWNEMTQNNHYHHW